MKIDLWPLFWAALVISIASCTYGSNVSYNECIIAGGVGCSKR